MFEDLGESFHWLCPAPRTHILVSKESRVPGAPSSTHILVKRGIDSSGEWLARGQPVVAVGGSVTACPFLSQTHRCLGGIDKATACSCMQGTVPKASQPVPHLTPKQSGETLCPHSSDCGQSGSPGRLTRFGYTGRSAHFLIHCFQVLSLYVRSPCFVYNVQNSTPSISLSRTQGRTGTVLSQRSMEYSEDFGLSYSTLSC